MFMEKLDWQMFKKCLWCVIEYCDMINSAAVRTFSILKAFFQKTGRRPDAGRFDGFFEFWFCERETYI